MRKRRTRGHIIEDLGFNHVERQVLLAGYTVQQITQDYGNDGLIQTFYDNGELEGDPIFFQLKSTDNIKMSSNGATCLFDLDVRDLEFWLSGQFFMILVLYDAAQNCAYFVDLKEYFKINRAVLANVRKFVRIYIPTENHFDSQAVKQLRKLKNTFHGKTKNV